MWQFLVGERRGLFIGGTLGFLLFNIFFSEISLTSNEDILYHKREAIKLARRYLQKLGYDPKEFDAACAYQHSNPIRWHLQQKLGRNVAVDSLENPFLNGDVWNICFHQNLPADISQEKFYVQITPDGNLKSFDHQIRDGTPAAELTPKEAMDIAYPFISQHALFDTSQYELQQSTEQLNVRRDYIFRWTKVDSILAGSIQHEIKIRGNKIEGYAFEFKIPPAKSNEFKQLDNRHEGLHRFIFPIHLMLFIWLLYEFFRRYKAVKHIQKQGLQLMGFAFIVYLAANLNGLMASTFERWSNVNIQSPLFSSEAFQQIVLKGIILSISIYLAWILGGLMLREEGRERRLISFYAILKLKWLTVDVAKAFASAFFLAGCITGFISIYGYFVSHFFNGMVDQAFFSDAFDKEFPWLNPLFTGMISALSIVIILFLFLSMILKKYLKHQYWVLLPILIILQFMGFSEMSFYPHFYSIILRLALGLFIFYIFNKYDVLTTFMTVFISISFIHAIPLVSTSNVFFVTSGVSACILLISTLFVSILGFRRNQIFTVTE